MSVTFNHDQKMKSDDQPDCEQDSEENAPGVRRPMNAFFIFCKRHRDIVREKYPHLENRCITKILGEWWANLDPSEKASYTSLAKQYKDAFMKAHPDFKWYKLPIPPARTLFTRTSSNKRQNEKNLSTCGIALGKLADDEQLGGLSSLINIPATLRGSSSNSLSSPEMAQKAAKNILKPPKKRYLINGEFKSNSEMVSSFPSKDFPSHSACSALLEFAEICTSNAVLESASTAIKSSDKVGDSELNLTRSQTASSSFPTVISKSSDCSLPSSITYPVLCSMQKSEHKKSAHLDVDSETSSRTADIFELSDQPLDLCKNRGKTITASHQQLIDHFVDKFLCDTPLPQNNSHKSPVLDPSLSKILSSQCLSDTVSEHNEIKHTFTLSVAIESAVDKAYNKDVSKSCKTGLNKNHSLVDQVTQNFNFNFKSDSDEKLSLCATSNREYEIKPVEQIVDGSRAFKNDQKNIHNPATVNTDKRIISNNLSKSAVENNSNNNICKASSPPKKSRVWCDIFMNEQLSKSDSVDDKSCVSQSRVSESPSPARRNSQRACKGRRYQALITEGLLQSAKERKGNSNKKGILPVDKEKSKNQMVENNVLCGPKKKRKKEETKSPRSESQEFNQNVFNLEEKIASLPKCNFELLSKRKSLSSNLDSAVEESVKPSTSTSQEKSSTGENKFSISSGRFKSGLTPTQTCDQI